MERQDLERMTREQLIAHAERLGIARPRVLTQPEIVDEIIGRTHKGERERAKARGWLGRARDLLATVVEKGLHLPEAARALRREEKPWPTPPPPLPTVTLAEIYAAQGHLERAIAVLDEVVAREADHREARALRERFVEQAQRSRSRAGREKEAPPSVKESAPPTKEAARDEVAPAAEAAAVSEKTEPEAAAATPAALEAKPAAAEAAPRAPDVSDDGAVTQPQGAAPAPAILAEPPPAPAELELPSTERAPAVSAKAEALDEPPLPQRYEVDEVVAIAVDPRTIYLYWEVRPTTLAGAQARRPEGELCVRLASVTASWEGPVVATRDLHVDALYGDRFVRDVQPGSNVRVSVGWKAEGGFEPFAVGADVTAPRMVPVESVSREVARWEAEPVAPFNVWRPDALSAGRDAVEALPLGRAAGHDAWGPGLARRARASADTTLAGLQGPVDTGVESWSEGYDVDLPVVPRSEATWYPPGASELARAAPGDVRPWRPRRGPGEPGRALRLGGASELSGS